jgi:hypothetical protein
MATEDKGKSISLPAYADYSTTGQFRAVYLSGGKARLCGASARAIGILQNKPEAADAAAEVLRDGVSLAVAGGSFSADDYLTTDANGDLVEASTGDEICAQALEDAVDNQVVSVLLLVQAVPNIA